MMKRPYSLVLIALTLLLLFVAGCSPTSQPEEAPADHIDPETQTLNSESVKVIEIASIHVVKSGESLMDIGLLYFGPTNTNRTEFIPEQARTGPAMFLREVNAHVAEVSNEGHLREGIEIKIPVRAAYGDWVKRQPPQTVIGELNAKNQKKAKDPTP